MADHYLKMYATCPYCDYEEYDSWEIEESGEIECSRCEKEYYVEIDLRYTSTK